MRTFSDARVKPHMSATPLIESCRIWLVGTGRGFMHEVELPRHFDEFLAFLTACHASIEPGRLRLQTFPHSPKSTDVLRCRRSHLRTYSGGVLYQVFIFQPAHRFI